jgi:hypothetical protein
MVTELQSRDLTVSSPRDTAVVEELDVYFLADSISSEFHADADFLDADIYLLRPLNELDSTGRGYQHYFKSFRELSHLTAASRLSRLPELEAGIALSYHELFDVFLGDSVLNFSQLDGSLSKKPGENSLHTILTGKELSYKSLETDRLYAEILDSAGSIVAELRADSLSLLSGPEYRLRLEADAGDRQVRARLSVDDFGERDVYLIEVAGRADSNRIALDIPDRRLILNGFTWQLEHPELLSIDLATNILLPELRMYRDSAYLHLSAMIREPFISYVADLNQVELSSLVRSDLLRGKPQGNFSGAIAFRTDRNTGKEINTDLWISDISYSGQDYNPIRLDGTFSTKSNKGYLFDLHARTDSLDIQLSGQNDGTGEIEMNGAFEHFPLVLFEPFAENHISEAEGSLSGDFDLSSRRGHERFTGQVFFHGAKLKVNLLNSVFRIPDQGIHFTEKKAVFEKFQILDTLGRPLQVDGYIEYLPGVPPVADLRITSSELQIMSRERRQMVPFTGNVFVDTRISVEGPFTGPDISGNIRLSQGSEIFYQHMEDLKMTETERIVNFVGYAPGEAVEKSPPLSGQGRVGRSSIATVIEIDPRTRINFTLAKRMFTIYLDVKGGGNLQYKLENEQMALSGKYEIGEGTTFLKLVGWPDKSFDLVEGGFIRWDGLAENPELGIEAESKVSTSYVNPIDGKNRDIDFFVMLRLTGYLEELDVIFTIRTPDQYVMSIINTLSPDEQMRQALSILLFEAIDLPGISSSTNYMAAQVNQILSSQLNQFTQSAIKGVDISFGLDTYDQSYQDGSNETTTSLSYEVSKKFLNNRAQIEFSGRLKDANETTTTDHSLNNLSFEYTLDSAATKYLKIYNEHTYDDVFEGEVIKTGVGFTYRKRYKTLKDIWRRKQ